MLESSTGHTGIAQPPLPSHPIRPRIGLRFEVVMIVLDCLAPSYLADVSVPYSQSTSSAFTKLSVQSGWYLRQKPVGEVRQVVSPPFPFPFPSPPLSIPPKFSDKPVGGKVRSSEREVPRLPPYKYQPGYSEQEQSSALALLQFLLQPHEQFYKQRN